MKSWRIYPSRNLRGEVSVPGDKSIGHRALLFGALADGTCHVRGLSKGLDNEATAHAFRSMGVRIEGDSVHTQVHGVGLRGLAMPVSPLDCGNSGTTMRLLAGLLSAQHFGTRLTGDESLTRRPMLRVVGPLRARGAHIAGVAGKKPDESYPPLSIAPLLPTEQLQGIEYEMPVASAQVKSALLLSGLYAGGPTILSEPVLSRDHTERMLVALGVPLETVGSSVALNPQGWSNQIPAFDWEVPGDFSSAAFFIAAALIVPGSEIRVLKAGTNPTRAGLLDVLRPMGASLTSWPAGSAAGDEPLATLEIEHGPLRPTLAAGEIITRMIDEVPAFCAIAAATKGVTEIRDAAELRVKESDRIATMIGVLHAFGVEAEELPDGMIIRGGTQLHAARVESHGDHRIAMSAALMAMIADGPSEVANVSCVDTSFPGFIDCLRKLGSKIEELT